MDPIENLIANLCITTSALVICYSSSSTIPIILSVKYCLVVVERLAGDVAGGVGGLKLDAFSAACKNDLVVDL